MIIGRGRVTRVDDSGPVQTMQVQMSGFELPDNRVRTSEFGLASNPPVGSEVVAVAITGDRTAGMVVGSNHQPSRPRNLLAGETKIYCQDGKFIHLTAAGGIIIEANGQNVVINNAANVAVTCSGTFTITAPGGIILDTPSVSATGNILDNSGTNTKTMAGMRGVHNIHTHPVSGSATGVPNQLE